MSWRRGAKRCVTFVRKHREKQYTPLIILTKNRESIFVQSVLTFLSELEQYKGWWWRNEASRDMLWLQYCDRRSENREDEKERSNHRNQILPQVRGWVFTGTYYRSGERRVGSQSANDFEPPVGRLVVTEEWKRVIYPNLSVVDRFTILNITGSMFYRLWHVRGFAIPRTLPGSSVGRASSFGGEIRRFESSPGR